MKPERRPARTQVVVAASLPPGMSGGQFQAMVARCVDQRLTELLGAGDYAVIAITC